MNRAAAWAALSEAAGALYKARQTRQSVDEWLENWCKANDKVADHNDSDRCAEALYLTQASGFPVSVVGYPETGRHVAVMEFSSDGGLTHVELPKLGDFEEFVPTEGRKRTKKAEPSNRKRLADPLWDALSQAGVVFEHDPPGIPGKASALAGKTVVYVRRCWYFRHATHQKDTGASLVAKNVKMHEAALKECKARGLQVFTLWECQLDGPAPEAIATELKARQGA